MARHLVTIDPDVRHLTLLAMLLAGCGGKDANPVEPAGPPSALVVVSGSGQNGVAGQPLADSVVVKATDAGSRPVAGLAIAFVPDANAAGAHVAPDTVMTDSQGRAATRWTLGSAMGTSSLVARIATGSSGLAITVTAEAGAMNADSMFAVSGDGQAGAPGQPLADSLVVKVVDAGGGPVSGIAVNWTFTGEGSVSPVQTVTDSAGLAETARIVGGGTGSVVTRATVAGLKGSPVTFTHTIVQPAAITMKTQPSATASSGSALDQPPAVEVRDASNNPIVGVGVAVAIESGGGTLNGSTTAATGSDGVATFTGLSISGTPGDRTLRFTSGTVSVVSSTVTVTSAGDAATVGEWTDPVSMPLVSIHVSLMPNSKVLMMSRLHGPMVWDPANPTSFTDAPVSSNLFCSGHTLMPDGRVFVAGGHIAENAGLPDANIFNPATNAWTRLPDMVKGRWYPTVMTLQNGQILVVAGRDQDSLYNTVPELWNGSSWVELTGASRPMPYYPRMFTAPDGRLFFAGEWQNSTYLDVNGNGGTGKWSGVVASHANNIIRDYGSAVMYEPYKIMYVGGGRPPTNTAETIDLASGTPTWTYTGAMAYARRHMNATLLPDGTVLALGGTSTPTTAFNSASGAVHVAELWNPATGQWRTMASQQVDRLYHSVGLLLPDGRVLSSGSGEGGGGVNQKTFEIFSPPYLFKGARPTIAGAPDVLGYGQAFTVTTPDAADITKAALIGLGSVTHAWDSHQRYLPLTYTKGSGSLSLTSPSDSRIAPPGYYMLFLLNGNGVPSIGKIVKIG